jgi:PIN domain nuclease of toxin-antitoxin system
MTCLLDTHAWVWWNMSPARLSRAARRAIDSPEQCPEILLSAISVWEFCKLVEKGRLGISCDPEEWIALALQMPRLRLVPLTPRIACRSTMLPQPFHHDPADQIIVATAREENAAIITKDILIRGYRHVRTVW